MIKIVFKPLNFNLNRSIKKRHITNYHPPTPTKSSNVDDIAHTGQAIALASAHPSTSLTPPHHSEWAVTTGVMAVASATQDPYNSSSIGFTAIFDAQPSSGVKKK
jgi:hypothetical protein